MPPLTLSLYLARRYILVFLATLIVLWLLIYFFDTVELLRRAENLHVGFTTILHMALFKLPDVGQEIIPFAILFSALITFWHLTRTHELVTIRSAGLSAWQFLFPAMCCALLLGVVHMMILNPIGSSLLSKFRQCENHVLKQKSSAIELAESGFWLRQANDGERIVIHAQTVNPATWQLKNVLILYSDADDHLTQRIDAPEAILKDGEWIIENGAITIPGQVVPVYEARHIATDLTPSLIEERFARPESISFWRLPHFMETLEKTGLSTTKLALHYQTLLAQPFLYAALVMLAAAFALRLPRSGYVISLIIAGLLTGFTIFLLGDITETLGSARILPTLLAAWGPGLITLLLGSAALLYLEDG